MERLAVFNHLRGLLGQAEGPSDADLLARFADRRDGDAFAELVRRHGPMVLGVCRRVLGNPHDAEDAFQATFLVLARKAAAVRRSCPTPAGWLHGVANRTALKSRNAAVVRRAKERTAAGMRELVWNPVDPAPDLRGVLDAELAGLPDRYRLAVVLCDLEGLSRAEAAGRLGWPEGTLSGRLARARSLLARRLSKYGLAAAGVALTGVSARSGLAAVSQPLIESTSQAAVLVAAGHTAAGVVPVAALELSRGVLSAMFASKLKVAVAGVMVVTTVAWTGAAGSWPAASAGPQDPPAKAGKATRDADADRIAQLERERDALKKQLANALDRLVALEEQVRVEQAQRRAQSDQLAALGLSRSSVTPNPPRPAGSRPTWPVSRLRTAAGRRRGPR
jgi:RNA polymerase sigma factor (sigma-70 family)